MTDLVEVLDGIGEPHILVLGDLILDRYTPGDAERVCPEAPAVVLRAESPEARPGGAAAVAYLLRGLDARVSLVGAVGDDEAGRALTRLLDEAGVERAGVFGDSERPTTTKDRFLGRAGGRSHQLLRVDRESRRPLAPTWEGRVAEAVVGRLSDFQAVLVSDYAKGVCTPRVLTTVIAEAGRRGVPVLIDPARTADYGRYRDADLVAPNRAEAELAAGLAIASSADALKAAERLCGQYALGSIVVKLDRDGMAFQEAGEPGRCFRTRARAVCDVTGAGDMVLAVLGLCRAAGVPWDAAAPLANAAAGLEVGRAGVAAVSRAEVRAGLYADGFGGGGERVTGAEMARLAESYRREGLSVVFSNGCFDLLHVGHVASLQAAARLGDVLVVAVNGDRGVRALKGEGRPVIPEDDRAALVAALACVDHVVVFDEETPHGLLWAIRPDVLAKGWVPTGGDVVGREVVEGYGGRVCVTGRARAVSTTDIVGSVRGGAWHAAG